MSNQNLYGPPLVWLGPEEESRPRKPEDIFYNSFGTNIDAKHNVIEETLYDPPELQISNWSDLLCEVLLLNKEGVLRMNRIVYGKDLQEAAIVAQKLIRSSYCDQQVASWDCALDGVDIKLKILQASQDREDSPIRQFPGGDDGKRTVEKLSQDLQELRVDIPHNVLLLSREAIRVWRTL